MSKGIKGITISINGVNHIEVDAKVKAKKLGYIPFNKKSHPDKYNELIKMNDITGKDKMFDWICPITDCLYSNEYLASHSLEYLKDKSLNLPR